MSTFWLYECTEDLLSIYVRFSSRSCHQTTDHLKLSHHARGLLPQNQLLRKEHRAVVWLSAKYPCNLLANCASTVVVEGRQPHAACRGKVHACRPETAVSWHFEPRPAAFSIKILALSSTYARAEVSCCSCLFALATRWSLQYGDWKRFKWIHGVNGQWFIVSYDSANKQKHHKSHRMQ